MFEPLVSHRANYKIILNTPSLPPPYLIIARQTWQVSPDGRQFPTEPGQAKRLRSNVENIVPRRANANTNMSINFWLTYLFNEIHKKCQKSVTCYFFEMKKDNLFNTTLWNMIYIEYINFWI